MSRDNVVGEVGEVGVETGDWASEKGSRRTEPRVKPSVTVRVTEMIFPVKRRMPSSEARREVRGSCFRERERAMERPISQAVRVLKSVLICQRGRRARGKEINRERSCSVAMS
jgi:hypothetical protein